jgi:acyl carrier protein
MDINYLIDKLETEFELPAKTLKAETDFRDIPEWGSMHALIIIAVVDTEFGITLNGEDMKKSSTINDLYNVIKSK